MKKIKQIQIHNFQSYEDITIDIHEGINIFVGTSNHGKSAIIRALLWVITNRPRGMGFISYWSLKNEKIDTSVKVFLLDGNVVERKRTEDFNGYIVNKKELEAVGSDVPFEVQEIFGLAPYNIQQQFDSPFLLSSSSGEVARFFNQVIKIDDIDKMLKVVEQKKRKTKFDLSYKETSIKQYEDDIKNLEWVNKIKDTINNAEKQEIQIKNQRKKIMDISVLHNNYWLKKDRYKEIDFIFLQNAFKSIQIVLQEYKEKERNVSILKNLIDAFHSVKQFLDRYKIDVSGMIQECGLIIDRINENERKKRILSGLVGNSAILYIEMQKYKGAEKLPAVFAKIEKLQSKNTRRRIRYDSIGALLDVHKKLSSKQMEHTEVEKVFTLFDKVDELQSKISGTRLRSTGLDFLIGNYKEIAKGQKNIEQRLQEIKEMMPDICPLCGNRLEGKI